MTFEAIVNAAPRYLRDEEPIIPILRVRMELHQAPAGFEFYQKMLEKLIGESGTVNWTFGNDTHDNESRTLEMDGPVGDIARLLTLIPKFHPAGELKEEYCDGFDMYGNYYDGNNGTYPQRVAITSPRCGYQTELPTDPPPVMKDNQDGPDA